MYQVVAEGIILAYKQTLPEAVKEAKRQAETLGLAVEIRVSSTQREAVAVHP
jgi:hypothetical protein